MRYPKLRELKEAIKALIKGPYTSKFPYAPHEPYEAFRGKPEFHEGDCIGCAACTQVCPSGALSFKDEIKNGKPARALIYTMDLCIFCGQCQANCPTEKGIMLTREFDLATTEKRQDLKQEIEKELIACECCGEVIVPKDQYLWVADRLGPLMFSNPSVFLTYLSKLSLVPKTEIASSRPGITTHVGTRNDAKGQPDSRRADRFRAMCPRCRREAILKS